jgi:hypothetical protein
LGGSVTLDIGVDLKFDPSAIPGFDINNPQQYFQEHSLSDLMNSGGIDIGLGGINISGVFGGPPTNNLPTLPWDECIPDQEFSIGTGWKIFKKVLIPQGK